MAKAHDVAEYFLSGQKSGRAHGEAQKVLDGRGRKKVICKEDQIYKDEAIRMAQFIEREREKVSQKVYSQRESVLKEADGLAKALSKRFVEEN